jgi:transketolase
MRQAFFETLSELAEADRRVTLVVGDIGFGFVEPFAAKFPGQFVNAGVAEQNMTGLAAGLAMAGRVVFTYSIGNFPTLRCLEQIRNDICYHRLSVKVVAVGAGYTYGALGVSHHATEDIAIMRALPEMRVISPGDTVETRLSTKAICETQGPYYLRLSRSSNQILPTDGGSFVFGTATVVRQGDAVTLAATGDVLAMALEVSNLLETAGVSARVLSLHSIKPLDTNAIHLAASETAGIITLEEHSIVGGLGSSVAEVIAEMPGPKASLLRIGLQPHFAERAGSQNYLRQKDGLSAEAIFARITTMWPEWDSSRARSKAGV